MCACNHKEIDFEINRLRECCAGYRARIEVLEGVETRMLAITRDFQKFQDPDNNQGLSLEWLVSRLSSHLVHTSETRA